MADQLGLFGHDSSPARSDRPAPARSTPAAILEERHERFRVLAASLPDGLHMGTSSWSFPGWSGIVYARRHSAATLAKDGLREYASHPLLRTVGIDRGYYGQIPDDDLRRFADLLPPGFPCCIKAPASVTAERLRDRGRPYPNPDFLSLAHLQRGFLEPLDRIFADHTGVVLFQFSPTDKRETVAAQAWVEQLDGFLGGLPPGHRYAVEVRDRWLLTDAYRKTLQRHGVAHVYNYWSAMPMPGEQARVLAPEDQPFVVVRLLLRPGTWYEEQRQVFAPFNALVEPDESMRRDVINLIHRAVGRHVFLLVNNKAEGSSPLTIEALAERLVAERPAR